MIDANVQNFEAEVVAASMQVPVLVDFWAPWCGPCKTLGPVLEKLEVAYGGRFKLVKINTEEEQQLAAMFGIRSIPTCYLMVGGQPVDGFAGALPEGQIRAFLDKHLPSADELQAGLDLLGAEAAHLAVYARTPLRSPSRQVLLTPMPVQAAEAAQALFAQLRAFDAAGVRLIWIETPPPTQDWEGVRDRLQRAAAAG